MVRLAKTGAPSFRFTVKVAKCYNLPHSYHLQPTPIIKQIDDTDNENSSCLDIVIILFCHSLRYILEIILCKDLPTRAKPLLTT